jgi:hypothetical protein
MVWTLGRIKSDLPHACTVACSATFHYRPDRYMMTLETQNCEMISTRGMGSALRDSSTMLHVMTVELAIKRTIMNFR